MGNRQTSPQPADPSPADPLAPLEGALNQATTALRQHADAGQRVTGVAAALRLLWPSLPVYACLVGDGSRLHVAVLDQQGKAYAWDGGPADSRDATERERVNVFPRVPAPSGHDWVTAVIAGEGVAHGALGVAIPEEAEADPGLRRLLGLCCRYLGRWLDAESRGRERDAAWGTVAEQTWLANLGTLASPITHEFNNFLNVLLLQIAVLEHELPDRRRGEFAVIRQQGKQVAELVRQWQQYRSRQQPESQPLDVNRAVREAAERMCDEEPGFGEPRLVLAAPGGEAAQGDGVRVRLELADGLPPVFGTLPDLQRLIRFLIGNAAAAIPSGRGVVTVRTGLGDEAKVWLRVEDTGPPAAAELLPQLFEPLTRVREGPNRLELAAAKTLAQRRLQGGIVAENAPGGGVAVTVTLRPWKCSKDGKDG